jgi:hypothetical protein
VEESELEHPSKEEEGDGGDANYLTSS